MNIIEMNNITKTYPLGNTTVHALRGITMSIPEGDFMSKKKDISALDIRTMHETASNIIKLEKVLNLITFLAVIILFFIILIGVVNTLRMTIKERTREIGTIRAIGMRRSDVRNLIITETFLLALFSTITGTVLSFAIMELSQAWEIHASSFMNILLVDHRLYFLPSALSILFNMSLILLITVITAYFPSKNAANKTVADALRHFE
ncbi:MAG: FtsX-like permease family protein [Proteobacteria bacterium]|nr:FtsX-like permease family protein [Pseudomonadota bacterium]